MPVSANRTYLAGLLFLRKRLPGEPQLEASWLSLAEAVAAEDGEPGLKINRYFLDPPRHVLGRHARTSTPYGVGYTCAPDPGMALEAALQGILTELPTGIALQPGEQGDTVERALDVAVGTAAAGAVAKEGSFILGRANELLKIVGGVPVSMAIRWARGTIAGGKMPH